MIAFSFSGPLCFVVRYRSRLDKSLASCVEGHIFTWRFSAIAISAARAQSSSPPIISRAIIVASRHACVATTSCTIKSNPTSARQTHTSHNQHARGREYRPCGCFSSQCEVHGFVRAPALEGCHLQERPPGYQGGQAQYDKTPERDCLESRRNPGIGHLKALVERKCIVCKKSELLPRRNSCTLGCPRAHQVYQWPRDQRAPHRRWDTGRDDASHPVDNYNSCQCQARMVVWSVRVRRIDPDVVPHRIPYEMTLAYFHHVHTNEVTALRARLYAEKRAKQE